MAEMGSAAGTPATQKRRFETAAQLLLMHSRIAGFFVPKLISSRKDAKQFVRSHATAAH